MQDRARAAPKRLSAARPSPAVGILVDCLDDSPYQWAVLRGAMDAAAARNAHLLCFAGGVLGATHGEGGERNFVFDFARPKNIDALVVLSGSVGKRIGSNGLREYCQRHIALPLCSIAVEVAGMSSVCVDNDSGMRAVVEHLVRVHGLKHIAFVRGPEANAEAEGRYGAYREALAANGIAFEAALVAPGDFEQSSGREAVDLLLTTRKLPTRMVQAFVTANDSMALGVLDELARRGIRVPDQVAVAGLDDVEEARFCLPPLTTVSQPLYEQGADGVRIVLDQLRNGAAPERVSRQTQTVLRRSCGCLSAHSTTTKESNAPGLKLGFESALIRRRQVILAEMSRASRGELSAAGAGWDERLLNAFTEQIRGDSSDAFVKAYDDLLRRLSPSGTDPSVCNDVVSAMRGRILRCLTNDPQRRTQAEDVFHEVRIMTAHVIDRVQAWRRMRAWRGARALGRAAAAVASARTLVELAHAVAAHLPSVGIERCYVLQRSGIPGEDRLARTILVHKPDGRRSDSPISEWLPASDVLRQHVIPTTGEHPFAVLPLNDAERELGVLVLQLGAPDGYLYETMREVFVAALSRGCLPPP